MIQLSLQGHDSYLVICPWCNDIWARLASSDTNHFWHRYVPCELHPEACFPYGARVAGSLLEFEVSLDQLSIDLIHREFKLQIHAPEPT